MWRFVGKKNQTWCDDFKMESTWTSRTSLATSRRALLVHVRLYILHESNRTDFVRSDAEIFFTVQELWTTHLLIFNKFFFDSGHFCECFFFRRRNKCSFRGISYYMWVTDHIEYTKTKSSHKVYPRVIYLHLKTC